jgi:serine O-acetyltransferase
MPIFQRLLAWDRHAMRLYRLEDWFYRRDHYDLAYGVSAISRVLTGVEVEPGAELAPGVKFMHGFGTRVGQGTRVGEGTVIFHQVTIGKAAGLPVEQDGYPTIGRDVYIYPGSILIGPITIGDGAKITAGAVVSKDVSSGAIVFGNPARQLGWVDGRGDSPGPGHAQGQREEDAVPDVRPTAVEHERTTTRRADKRTLSSR